jgi:hypothetical protein
LQLEHSQVVFPDLCRRQLPDRTTGGRGPAVKQSLRLRIDLGHVTTLT